MKAALSAIALFLLPCLSHAEPPPIISYQGRVAVQGTSFSGTGQFNFALINASGSETYWESNGVALNVAAGLFTVRLGDTSYPNMAALTPGIFTQHDDVWLRVAFNDGTHGFQTVAPNTRMVAVPYALSAKSAESSSRAEWATTAGFGFPANAREFKEAGTFTFNVPAGVNRILVEVWGGGGGGIPVPAFIGWDLISGCSGAYSRKAIDVNAGDVLEISVGNAGARAVIDPDTWDTIVPATAGGPSKVSRVGSAAGQRTVLCVSEGGGGAGQGPGETTVIARPDPSAAIGREGSTVASSATNGTVEPPFSTVGVLGEDRRHLSASDEHGYVLLQW